MLSRILASASAISLILTTLPLAQAAVPPATPASSQTGAKKNESSLVAWRAKNDRISIAVNDNGGCSLEIAGKQWFSSLGVAMHCDGKRFRSFSGPNPNQRWEQLRKVSATQFAGEDKLGKYSGHKINWLAGGTKFETNIRVYKDCIVFAQSFPAGASRTGVKPVKPNNKLNFPAFSPVINDADAESAFPLFDCSRMPENLQSISFWGCWAVPRYGKRLDNYIGGTESGAPVIVYDSEMNTIVLSPLNHFLSAVQTKSKTFDGYLACGVSGRVEKLPPGFTQETILYAGTGINQTMFDWGTKLLEKGGKSRSEFTKDETVKYLGYYTDNGAYYFDKNEPGKNFEQTMIDVAGYLHSAKIPAKYLHLDANWYTFSKKDGGTFDWTARQDAVPGGLRKLSECTGLPFAVQNSFWSADAKSKRKYHFLQSPTSTLPTSSQFWMELMQRAHQNNIKLYEQDFLNISFEKSVDAQNSVTVPEQWLGNMDQAAMAHDVKIAYCMPFVSDYLASTLYPSVTQIRATTDYIGNSGQWRIGVNSLLAWSLGMAPFKDTFWSSKFQPGGKYEAKVHESNCELEALSSALSSGAVGSGDKIGCVDRALLLKCCRPDGLLLKPDKPATPIDRWFLMDKPKGEIWDTNTKIGGQRWHYFLIADHKARLDLKLSDIGESTSRVVRNVKSEQLSLWPSDNSFSIDCIEPSTGSIPFGYFEIAPVAADGLSFLGEEDKFISISRERFSVISTDHRNVTLTGVPGETVHLQWRLPEHADKVALRKNGLDQGQVSFDRASQIVRMPVGISDSGKDEVELIYSRSEFSGEK
jgi:hypothetical protein